MSAIMQHGKRRYNVWAGNPYGVQEDPNNCIEECAFPGRMIMYHQCSRKRGFGPDGLYCKQHAKKLAEHDAWIQKLKDAGVPL